MAVRHMTSLTSSKHFDNTKAARAPADSPQCCLCFKSIDPVIALLQNNLQPRIIRTLVANFPAWGPDQSICSDCALQVVQHADRERSRASLHYELGMPFPIYSRAEATILPTPTRTLADYRFTGRGITVAFLDSGFYAHPDLVSPTSRIKLYVDATGSRPKVLADFDNPPTGHSWHGTMTSSIALGNGYSSAGEYRGLAPDADLVAIKTGYRGRRISETDIMRALTWVVDNHRKHAIRIVNISLGGDRVSDGNPTPLDEMIEEAVAQGLVVVCASGNEGAAKIYPPASAPSAIVVGGLDDQNTLDRRMHGMYRSNWGVGVGGSLKPDLIAQAMWLAAPMVHQTDTFTYSEFLWDLFEANDQALRERIEIDYARARFTRDMVDQPVEVLRRAIRTRLNEDKFIRRGYQHVDGTSMSAPIVTGVVAQMLEANPKLTPAQVKQILVGTARHLAGVPTWQQGGGVVDAGGAVARALRFKHPDLRKTPASPNCFGQMAELTFVDPKPASVFVVGSFNDWRVTGDGAVNMASPKRGVWRAALNLGGVGDLHYYKFVLDGERWLHDPENPDRVEDACGGFFSVLSSNKT